MLLYQEDERKQYLKTMFLACEDVQNGFGISTSHKENKFAAIFKDNKEKLYW